MKRFFVILAVFSLSLGFWTKAYSEDRDCSHDDAYDRNQSLVVYHYQDNHGEEQRLVVAQKSDLPDSLKDKCWECWVDALEWFNCSEK